MTYRFLSCLPGALLVLLCALSAGAVHAAGTLWQIGTLDGSYREFALAGRYADYPARFPHDVSFQVGRSKPRADWPYIHPGPGDPWAGLREHPYRIRFRLSAVPATACRLNVHLVDARHGGEQTLQADINGRAQYRWGTEPGSGEASLSDPSAGRQSTISLPFPAGLLQPGANEITLTMVGGCWMLYDAVTLETGPQVPRTPVVAEAQAVLRPADGAGAATVALSILNAGQEGDIEVALPGEGSPARTLHLQPGRNQLTLPLTAPLTSPPAELTLLVGGQRRSVPVQQPAVVWRIGSPDGSYDDLAIARDYPSYSRAFPADVTYRVGESDPRHDWPFIHPGLHDAWAGARTHPFRINFSLPRAPTGASQLQIDLVDTQPRGGPTLAVAVNDRAAYRLELPRGGSDDSLQDPRLGHPCRVVVPIAASLLQAGDNHLVLTIASGSWMAYDSLALWTGTGLPDGPVPGGIAGGTTPLFRRVNGALRQMVRIATRNNGVQGEVEVSLDGGVRARQTATLVPGENTVDLLVPPIAHAAPVKVTIQAPGGACTGRFIAQPERRWRVYVGPSTHTDIGYTDFQERVYERHNDNTTTALAACATTPDFRWNLEVGYQAELLRQRDPEGYRELMRQVRAGRIGLGGLYLNMLTGLCSGEELVRSVTFVQDRARPAGATAEAASLTDVPTAVGTLPMMLAHSGVRYFADGANDFIPFYWGGRAMDHYPYWWEGLDGSRVLAITTHAYAHAGLLGLLDDVATVEQRLPDWLRQMGRDGYPGDAAYIYGAFSDNQPMTPRYAQVAADWNSKWEYPKLIVARVDEFFRDVEARVGPALPVVRGDMGVVWENGAASTALETAMVRQARTRLAAGEGWHALAAALGTTPRFPAARVRDAWDQVLLYDEHTWGAAQSVTEPGCEQTRHQWAAKAAFATRATAQADALLSSGLAAFGHTDQPRPAAADTGLVTVYNEQSWPRDILVSAPLSGSLASPGVCEVGGDSAPLPCQRDGDGLVFEARQVPPLGWRTYRIAQTASPDRAVSLLHPGPDPWSWETDDFRFRIDAQTGALSSLYDKRLRTEWAAGTAGLGLNQFVYVLGEPAGTVDPTAPLTGLDEQTHTAATVALLENGPVRAVLHISRTGAKAPPTDTYLVLRPGRRIELLNVVHKPDVLAKEAGYFAFPFRLDPGAPRAAYVELPYGVMTLEKDQAPGGCRDWYTTNSFAAVSDGRRTACLATPHAPLLTVNDIFRGLRRGRLEPLNGCLFAYVLNNYWGTNYKASQSGDLVFSFSLSLDKGAFSPLAATRFGWDALATMVDPAAGADPDLWRRGAQPAPAGAAEETTVGSALQLSEGPVVVGGVSYRGGRLLVRLYNTAGEASLATLALPGHEITGAWAGDLVGRPGARLPVTGQRRQAQIKVPGRGLATVLLSVRKGR